MAPHAMLVLVMPVCALLAMAPSVQAQPVPGPEPAPVPAPPPTAHPLFPLAQSGAGTGIGGLPPELVGSIGQPGGELTLGQHAVPSIPGTAPATPLHPNALNNQYLLPQHVAPAAPGEGTLVGVEPGREHADIGAIDYLRRLWETYQAGGLEGGLLGQRSVDTSNKPLEAP
ncbi:hypothetical protein [Mycolicibacterium vaccae]|uniref:hypothetical protein n=1 Tax=Mycolicibacterium vaccae TaxID=1810 RepID=UPI003D095001